MWLARTPSAIVFACAAMIPRLEGEAAVRAINIGGVANGTLEQDAIRHVTANFLAMAEGRKLEPVKADPAKHAQESGFKVKLVPTKRITAKHPSKRPA